jgi:hypothetical protein
VISYETSHSGVNKTHSLRKQRVGIDPSNFVQATRLSELLLGKDGAVRSEHVRTVGGHDVLFLPLAEQLGMNVIATLFLRLMRLSRRACRS